MVVTENRTKYSGPTAPNVYTELVSFLVIGNRKKKKKYRFDFLLEPIFSNIIFKIIN